MTERFGEMTRLEKLVHILKVTLCILSFGFIYPNILRDD
jgi:hypothetical protein